MSESIVYKFLPLAENTARKWYRIVQGEARGLELEDVLAEARAQLPSIAKTYDPTRGSVVAVVKPVVWRHLERKYRRDLDGDRERTAIDELPEHAADATQDRAALAQRVAAWANTAARSELLTALDAGVILTPAQRELLRELRAHMEAPQVPTKGLWSAARAARYLGIPERVMRELCETGQVMAVRDRGWSVTRKEVDGFRRRAVRKRLAEGDTLRQAAAAAAASLVTAQRVHAQLPEPRPVGRPQIHDRALLLAALTNETTAPHTWRRGYPQLRAISRWSGAPQKTVQRLHAELIKLGR